MGKEKVTYWVRRVSAKKYKVDPVTQSKELELAIVVKTVESADSKIHFFAYFEDSGHKNKTIGHGAEDTKTLKDFLKKSFREATEAEAAAFLL